MKYVRNTLAVKINRPCPNWDG